VAADGFGGCVEDSPFDRIIGTCQTRRIPPAWVEQAGPGGRILAVLPDGMVRLEADGAGGGMGRFDPFPVGFMWMRGHSPTYDAAQSMTELMSGAGETRRPRVDVMAVLRGEQIPSFWPIALTTFLPFYRRTSIGPGEIGFMDQGDRSWVRVRLDGTEVVQGGPRRLWDLIEELYDLLEGLGRPGRERFGLTVCPDSRQFVWFDSPQSAYRWEL
jgi:hypothetical protein